MAGSDDDLDDRYAAAALLRAGIVKSKEARRVELAALPFAEKIEIMMRMRAVARALRGLPPDAVDDATNNQED